MSLSANKLPGLIKKITPGFIRFTRINYLNRLVKKKFLKANAGSDNDELQAIINYLQNHPFSCYPYEFVGNYTKAPVDNIKHDGKSGHLFIIIKNEYKLFFPKGFSKVGAAKFYNWICMEQDAQSPHRYIDDIFDVSEGAVLLDVGAAEGLFGLVNIKRARKILVLEKEKSWLSALNNTYGEENIGKKYHQKVTVVEKYLSSRDTEEMVTLETLCKGFDDDVVFVKMDIEGMEYEVLASNKDFLTRRKRMKLAIACYHYQHDADQLKALLESAGFKVTFTKGYILTYMNGISFPYYRHCILRAEK